MNIEMTVYILRKHEEKSYGTLRAFEIVEASFNKKRLIEICKKKNEMAQKFFYTVGTLKVKDSSK